MYKGLYSDTEGWNVWSEPKETRDEVINWFLENGIDLERWDAGWWNPSPTIIDSNLHIETFLHFQY